MLCLNLRIVLIPWNPDVVYEIAESRDVLNCICWCLYFELNLTSSEYRKGLNIFFLLFTAVKQNERSGRERVCDNKDTCGFPQIHSRSTSRR